MSLFAIQNVTRKSFRYVLLHISTKIWRIVHTTQCTLLSQFFYIFFYIFIVPSSSHLDKIRRVFVTFCVSFTLVCMNTSWATRGESSTNLEENKDLGVRSKSHCKCLQASFYLYFTFNEIKIEQYFETLGFDRALRIKECVRVAETSTKLLSKHPGILLLRLNIILACCISYIYIYLFFF